MYAMFFLLLESNRFNLYVVWCCSSVAGGRWAYECSKSGSELEWIMKGDEGKKEGRRPSICKL